MTFTNFNYLICYPATWHPPVPAVGGKRLLARGLNEPRRRECAAPGGRVLRESLRRLPKGAPLKIKTALSLISLSLALTMLMGCGSSGGSNQTATISGEIQTGTGSQGGSNQDGTNSSDPGQIDTSGVSTGETSTSDVSTGQTGTSDGAGQTEVTNTVSLAWDMPTTYVDGTPLTDLAGFKVYCGTASGVYPQVVDVRNATSFSSGTLGPGIYYFAVTAYDSYGSESEFSNEISTTIL